MEKLKIFKVFGENLRAMMDSKKLRQDSFKRKTGISQSSIGRYLNAEAAVTLGNLEKIAGFLDVEPWHMLVPNLDPSNLPVVLISEVEREFYRRMKDASSLLNNTQDSDSRANTIAPNSNKADSPKSHNIDVGIRKKIGLVDEGEDDEGAVKVS